MWMSHETKDGCEGIAEASFSTTLGRVIIINIITTILLLASFKRQICVGSWHRSVRPPLSVPSSYLGHPVKRWQQRSVRRSHSVNNTSGATRKSKKRPPPSRGSTVAGQLFIAVAMFLYCCCCCCCFVIAVTINGIYAAQIRNAANMLGLQSACSQLNMNVFRHFLETSNDMFCEHQFSKLTVQRNWAVDSEISVAVGILCVVRICLLVSLPVLQLYDVWQLGRMAILICQTST